MVLFTGYVIIIIIIITRSDNDRNLKYSLLSLLLLLFISYIFNNGSKHNVSEPNVFCNIGHHLTH